MALLVGCQFTNPLEVSVDPTGRLELELPSAGARTITSDLTTEIAGYDVGLTGPSGDLLLEDVSGGTVQVGELAPGMWSVSVLGRNASGVSVSWSEVELDNPRVRGTLTAADGSMRTMRFSRASHGFSASYARRIPDGYYLMSLTLSTGDTTVWQVIEAVQVVAAGLTSERYQLGAAEVDLGGISVVVVEDMNQPLPLKIDLSAPAILQDERLTATAVLTVPAMHGGGDQTGASEPEQLEGDEYQWYLDGELLEGETGPVAQITGDRPVGEYELTGVVRLGDVFASARTSGAITADVTTVVGSIVSVEATTQPTNGTLSPVVFGPSTVFVDSLVETEIEINAADPDGDDISVIIVGPPLDGELESGAFAVTLSGQ